MRSDRTYSQSITKSQSKIDRCRVDHERRPEDWLPSLFVGGLHLAKCRCLFDRSRANWARYWLMPPKWAPEVVSRKIVALVLVAGSCTVSMRLVPMLLPWTSKSLDLSAKRTWCQMCRKPELRALLSQHFPKQIGPHGNTLST